MFWVLGFQGLGFIGTMFCVRIFVFLFIKGQAYSRQGLVLQGSVFCSSRFIGWCF